MKPFYFKQSIVTLLFLLVSLPGISQCTAPANLALTNATATHAVVYWSNGSSVVTYEYSVTDTSSTAPGAGGVTTTNNTTLLQGLKPFHCYTFWLRSVCGMGDTSQWENITVCTLDTCITPTPSVTNITDTSAVITWVDSGGRANSYEYFADTSNAGPTGLGLITSTTSSALSGLKPGTTYYFYIRSMCSSGAGPWVKISFTTTTTGVDKIYNANGFGISAYPNPANSIVFVRLYGASKGAAVFITDLAGKTIMQEAVNSNEMKINISDLPAGLYILKYTSEGQQQSVKLTKE